MKCAILRRVRLRSGFNAASMQIPAKNAEISSHRAPTSIFGFSNATFAQQPNDLAMAVHDRLPGFCGQAVELPHRAHEETALLIGGAVRGVFKKPLDILP